MWNWNFHKFCPEGNSDGTWFVPFQSKMKPVPWFQKNCLVPLHHWLPYWLILPPPLGLCHHWTSNRFLVSGLQHNYPKKVEKLWKFYNFIKKITYYEIFIKADEQRHYMLAYLLPANVLIVLDLWLGKFFSTEYKHYLCSHMGTNMENSSCSFSRSSEILNQN